MTTHLFPTIGSEHWRAMFAAHRAMGHFHGNSLLAQIRAAVARGTIVPEKFGAETGQPNAAERTRSDDMSKFESSVRRPAPSTFPQSRSSSAKGVSGGLSADVAVKEIESVWAALLRSGADECVTHKQNDRLVILANSAVECPAAETICTVAGSAVSGRSGAHDRAEAGDGESLPSHEGKTAASEMATEMRDGVSRSGHTAPQVHFQQQPLFQT